MYSVCSTKDLVKQLLIICLILSFAITLFLNIASSYERIFPKPAKLQQSACSKPWLGTRQGGWETEQVSLLRLQKSKPVHVWLRARAGLFWGTCNLDLLPWQLWISQFHSRSNCFWECLFLQIQNSPHFESEYKREINLNSVKKMIRLRFKKDPLFVRPLCV